MRVIADIEPAEFEKIRSLVAKGAYRHLQDFIGAAVTNQLHLEETGEVGIAAPTIAEQPSSNLGIPLPNRDAIGPAATLRPVAAATVPLWGQYYRFLPLKLVLRMVGAETLQGPVAIDALAGKVAPTARAFAKRLEKPASNSNVSPLPGFLATSGTQVKLAKSETRFIAQYLGSVGKDGRPRGFPFDVGYLGLTDRSGLVALTEAGKEFARSPNPYLDEQQGHELPLSPDEANIVLRHIHAALPAEADQIRELSGLLAKGPRSPADLDKHFLSYYQRKYGQWSEAKCTTMRAGLTSRCVELGLVANRDGSYSTGPRFDSLNSALDVAT